MTLTEHVEVIYCDDIRQELGGKQSLMGVYSGDMIVAEMPVTLPKLGILVTIICPNNQRYEFLEVKVDRDGDTILTSGRVFTSDLKIPAPPKIDGDDAIHHMALGVAFMISPLVVERPSKLRVVVESDRGMMRGRALYIHHQNSTQIAAK